MMYIHHAVTDAEKGDAVVCAIAAASEDAPIYSYVNPEYANVDNLPYIIMSLWDSALDDKDMSSEYLVSAFDNQHIRPLQAVAAFVLPQARRLKLSDVVTMCSILLYDKSACSDENLYITGLRVMRNTVNMMAPLWRMDYAGVSEFIRSVAELNITCVNDIEFISRYAVRHSFFAADMIKKVDARSIGGNVSTNRRNAQYN